MRSGTTLALALIAALAVATPLCAEDAQQAPEPAPTPQAQGSIEGCDVPDNLLATDSVLQKVADAVKAGKPLDILVIGSRSSTIPQSEASAYPARLQVALKDALPKVTVNLSVEIQPKTTAEDAIATFAKMLEAR